jgi:hypothetical protein
LNDRNEAMRAHPTLLSARDLKREPASLVYPAMPPSSSSSADELQALRAELAAMKGELRVVTVERYLLREKQGLSAAAVCRQERSARC